MIKAVFGFFGRVLRFIFCALDWMRRLALNLLFLFILGVLVFMFSPSVEREVAEGAALVIRPAGALVEEAQLESPLALLRRGSGLPAQTELHTLVDAVRAARDDERIAGLVIETDDLSAGGLAKLGELRAAIEAFKTSGKPVLARGERFTESQYYLASVADQVHLAPDGFLLMRGLAAYQNFYGDLLDRLGAKLHVFRAGEYKSFSEIFTRSEMSDESRRNTVDLLNGVWSEVRAAVSVSRELDAQVWDAWIYGFDTVLEAAGGDPARAALNAGFVDTLSEADEWKTLLIEHFGAGANGRKPRGIEAGNYLKARAQSQGTQARIAVLVAQGAIVDSGGAPGGVVGEEFARRIRAAREDASVRALVVRIDSPGGSAWAAERIRRELDLTRRAGKPVVVSMSSTAASGGYWIAAGADEIHALPLTLTGSIGVFALIPDLSATLEEFGITSDGVATGPLAGLPDPRRPLPQAAADALQSSIDHSYERFIDIVANARDIPREEVDRVARGQVWTGEAAYKLGLVDALGGLNGAVEAAAKRANLEQWEIVRPTAERSSRDRVLRRMIDFAGLDEPPAAGSSAALALRFERMAETWLMWNDPRGLYAHCLCTGP